MMIFETFLEEVQTALNRLYDPTFQPSQSFLEMLARRAEPSTAWQDLLRQTIAAMQPSPETPPEARSRRIYQVLSYRYVEQLTQDETAGRLHITARHVRREQSEAVTALAQILWQRAQQAGEPHPSPDWSAQLRQELTSLQRHAPAGIADVEETLRGVVDLLAPVLANTGVTLRASAHRPGLMAMVHAAGLRQLLVRAITEWSRHLSTGTIEPDAYAQAEQIRIEISGDRAPIDHLREDALMQELLAKYGGALEIDQRQERTILAILLPAAPPIRVLVVDDNEDLHHFYRRYLQETRYQITALTDGSLLFETVESLHPNIIILDVMLPSSDGWELLSLLRQHPLSRTLPIIVCSVIQEEELALALGATGYLAKPVRRGELIAALDTAIRPATE
ncbi:MAG: response regulator [Caldilineaceae bacterium]|nr:response regulator [Caldilineaceae bacterium]